MQITAKQSLVVEIDEQHLAYALVDIVAQKLDVKDDAGCDWFTDNDFNIYIGSKDWWVGKDINLAKTIDTANYLLLGHAIHIFDD